MATSKEISQRRVSNSDKIKRSSLTGTRKRGVLAEQVVPRDSEITMSTLEICYGCIYFGCFAHSRTQEILLCSSREGCIQLTVVILTFKTDGFSFC